MDCNAALEAMSAALDGELTLDEKAQLDTHLAHCPSCRALRQELAGIHDACDLNAAPPLQLKEQIMASLPPQRGAKAPVRFRWTRWGALAASVVLIALAAWQLPRLFTSNGGTDAVPAAPGAAAVLRSLSPAEAIAEGADAPSSIEEYNGDVMSAVLPSVSLSPEEAFAAPTPEPDQALISGKTSAAPAFMYSDSLASAEPEVKEATVATVEPDDTGVTAAAGLLTFSTHPPQPAEPSEPVSVSSEPLIWDEDEPRKETPAVNMNDPDWETSAEMPDEVIPADEPQTVYCGVLHLPAGPLGGDWARVEQADGSVWYYLPADQFYDLAQQLQQAFLFDDASSGYDLRQTGEDIDLLSHLGLVITAAPEP